MQRRYVANKMLSSPSAWKAVGLRNNRPAKRAGIPRSGRPSRAVAGSTWLYGTSIAGRLTRSAMPRAGVGAYA